jgi:transcriptional regulator with XRE-family HTH domain
MLSKNLETIRRMWGFNQKELADLLGVTQPMYQTYEKGTREPSTDFLIDLEGLTGFPIRRLWRETIDLKELPRQPLRPRRYESDTDVGQTGEDSELYGEIKKMKESLQELERKVLATH